MIIIFLLRGFQYSMKKQKLEELHLEFKIKVSSTRYESNYSNWWGNLVINEDEPTSVEVI